MTAASETVNNHGPAVTAIVGPRALAPDLVASNIAVAFGDRPVLNGISTTICSGVITAIIGPNGAGKSTLLRVLAGVLEPQSGEVLLGGKRVRDITYCKRAAAVAFASSGTGSGAGGLSAAAALSVGQYAAIGSAGLVPPLSPEAACAAVGNALSRTGLRDRATDPLGVLSSGLQQLATLARVLVQLDGGTAAAASGEDDINRHAAIAPDLAGKVLLLDEPTSAMDPRHIQLVLALLRQLAARGAAVVLATHDLPLACQGDAVLMLGSDGLIAADGPTETVITPERLAAIYGIDFEVITRPGKRPTVVAAF